MGDSMANNQFGTDTTTFRSRSRHTTFEEEAKSTQKMLKNLSRSQMMIGNPSPKQKTPGCNTARQGLNQDINQRYSQMTGGHKKQKLSNGGLPSGEDVSLRLSALNSSQKKRGMFRAEQTSQATTVRQMAKRNSLIN
jgi:hypothetical protein